MFRVEGGNKSVNDAVTVVLLVSGLEKGHAPLTGGACNVVPFLLSPELGHACDKRTTGLMDVFGATLDRQGSACRGCGKLDSKLDLSRGVT